MTHLPSYECFHCSYRNSLLNFIYLVFLRTSVTLPRLTWPVSRQSGCHSSSAPFGNMPNLVATPADNWWILLRLDAYRVNLFLSRSAVLDLMTLTMTKMTAHLGTNMHNLHWLGAKICMICTALRVVSRS